MKCRKERSARNVKTKRAETAARDEHNETFHDLRQAAAKQAKSTLPDVMAKELGPIVREALTEDVLKAIRGMINLTPRAIELMQLDLESDDPVIRQRAYTLVAKYTMGNPAVIQPKDTEPNAQIVVNFALPRPDDPATIDSTITTTEDPDEAPLVKECDICGLVKPESEFVANSTRCDSCFVEYKAKILEQYGN